MTILREGSLVSLLDKSDWSTVSPTGRRSRPSSPSTRSASARPDAFFALLVVGRGAILLPELVRVSSDAGCDIWSADPPELALSTLSAVFFVLLTTGRGAILLSGLLRVSNGAAGDENLCWLSSISSNNELESPMLRPPKLRSRAASSDIPGLRLPSLP